MCFIQFNLAILVHLDFCFIYFQLGIEAEVPQEDELVLDTIQEIDVKVDE